MEYKVALRIVVVSPLVGYKFWLGDDGGNKFSETQAQGEDIIFDFEAVVKENRRTGAPNFTGTHTKGTPSKRVINVGHDIGGAKIWITGFPKSYEPKPKEITWDMVKEVASDPNKVLMAKYIGTNSSKGIPSCATVQLIDGGWIIAKR